MSKNRTIATEIARLQKDIEQIEGPEHARVVAAKDERANAYVAYFDNLVLEQQPYGTIQGLAERAKKTLGVAWASGKSEKIKRALDEFLTDFRTIPPKNYLRSDATLQDVFNWIYEVDHVRLTYGLRYNGAELDKLSPGTKGIVLLILYLGMDVSDTRPLVIDQPDENLDNESIFKLLKMYFRDAKARRQIILISHNPNLVVNADSEQLIVAMCDRGDDGLPRITYTMGALENSEDDGTGIRQHACRILEGGAEAFRNRESRYSLRSTIRA